MNKLEKYSKKNHLFENWQIRFRYSTELNNVSPRIHIYEESMNVTLF